MQALKVMGHVDESHQLVAQVPASVGPVPVEVVLLTAPVKEDDAGVAWAAGVMREWQADLGDPHQDIYTLADGEPVHLSR